MGGDETSESVAEGGSDGGDVDGGTAATPAAGVDSLAVTGGIGEGEVARDAAAAGHLFTAAPEGPLLTGCAPAVSGVL